VLASLFSTIELLLCFDGKAAPAAAGVMAEHIPLLLGQVCSACPCAHTLV
jgi:hypothetical protein